MADTINFLEFDKLLSDFNSLSIKETDEPTFLEVLKLSNKENVCSDILAFFLDPNKAHGLHELLIKSITLALKLDLQISNLSKIKVTREFLCIDNKRLDIVIVADDFVIGIENKINAHLYNDLENYSESIKKLAGDKKQIKIVLSKNKCNIDDNSGFINLTYFDFVTSIKSLIADYYHLANTKYFIFLFDFITNLEKLINSRVMIEQTEVLDFFQNNATSIKDIGKINGQIIGELNNCLYKIHEQIQIEKIENIGNDLSLTKTDIFDEDGLMFKIKINKNTKLLIVGEVVIDNYKFYAYFYGNGEKQSEISKKLEEKELKNVKLNKSVDSDWISEKIKTHISKIIKTMF